jgi:hypothetical protein
MKKIPLLRTVRTAAVSPKLLTIEQLLDAASAGVEPVAAWLDEIATNGRLGRTSTDRITEVVRTLGIRTYPVFAKKGDSDLVLWIHEYPSDSVSAETECALALVAAADAGNLSRIHRCVLEDCRKFFMGDPRSKWCSNACGAKVRQRKFRKSRR